MVPGTIELSWVNEDDIITNDGRVTVVTNFNDTTITKIIHFDPLALEDVGKYTCYATINGLLIYEFTELQDFISKHVCSYICKYVMYIYILYIQIM